MTKEERKEIYAKLLDNLQYNENYGIPECEIRKKMAKFPISGRLKFNEERIDAADYDHKVPGNSYDAALYLVKKFHGVMFQKKHNENVIHYYVAYLDENGIVRVANPASDFNTPKESDNNWRLDIPLENFKPKSQFQTEIGVQQMFIANCESARLVLKINSNLIVHNYNAFYGEYPKKSKLIELNIEPSTITAFLAEDDAKAACKDNRTK